MDQSDEVRGVVMRGPDGAVYLVPADAAQAVRVLDPGTEQEARLYAVALHDLSSPESSGRERLTQSLDRILRALA